MTTDHISFGNWLWVVDVRLFSPSVIWIAIVGITSCLARKEHISVVIKRQFVDGINEFLMSRVV